MPWEKSPPALIAAFDAALPDDPVAQRRPMFGYPSAVVNGHMFAGLFRDRVVLRLSDADTDALGALGGEPFEPMPGRPMRGFAVAPAHVADDGAQLRAWIERAFAYSQTLPPKAAKAPKAARSGTRRG